MLTFTFHSLILTFPRANSLFEMFFSESLHLKQMAGFSSNILQLEISHLTLFSFLFLWSKYNINKGKIFANKNEDKMVQNAIFDSGQAVDIFHKDVKTLRTYIDPWESPSQKNLANEYSFSSLGSSWPHCLLIPTGWGLEPPLACFPTSSFSSGNANLIMLIFYIRFYTCSSLCWLRSRQSSIGLTLKSRGLCYLCYSIIDSQVRQSNCTLRDWMKVILKANFTTSSALQHTTLVGDICGTK